MNSIFIGLLFCSFNFSINIGNFAVGLIPNFVGFYFITKGLREISAQSSRFSGSIALSQIMTVYWAAIYAVELFHIAIPRIIATPLGIGATVIYLLILFNISQGMCEIFGTPSNADKLKQAWFILAVTTGATYLGGFITFAAVIFNIAHILVQIWYIICFYQTKKSAY